MRLNPLLLTMIISINLIAMAQTPGDKNNSQKPTASQQRSKKKSFDMDDVERPSSSSDLFNAPASSPLKPASPTAGNAAANNGKVIDSTIIGTFQSAERNNKTLVLSRYQRAQGGSLYGFILNDN